MKTIILNQDDFRRVPDYHMDVWEELIILPFNLDSDVTEIELTVTSVKVLAEDK